MQTLVPSLVVYQGKCLSDYKETVIRVIKEPINRLTKYVSSVTLEV